MWKVPKLIYIIYFDFIKNIFYTHVTLEKGEAIKTNAKINRKNLSEIKNTEIYEENIKNMESKLMMMYPLKLFMRALLRSFEIDPKNHWMNESFMRSS